MNETMAAQQPDATGDEALNGIAEDNGPPISSWATQEQADARLSAMDGKLDTIMAKLARLEANAAQSAPGEGHDPSAPFAILEALRSDLRGLDEKWTAFMGARKDIAAAPRFEAEKANFERILTGFRLVLRDLGQQAMQSRNADEAPAVTSAHPLLAPVEALQARLDQLDLSPLQQALESIGARIDALQAAQAPLAHSVRPNIRFDAEKLGFERILAGFRFVLRDLSQQAIQQRPAAELVQAPPPSEQEREIESPVVALEARPEPVDLSPFQRMFGELRSKLEAIESAVSPPFPLAAESRPNMRFEAEKVGFERILTGFRLVLRDLGQQAMRAESESESATESAVSSLLAPLESLRERLDRLDAPRLHGAMDEMRDRLGTLESVLAARPEPPAHGNALFEAEKVGLGRLLTGFRLVLRDLSDRVQALEVTPPPASMKEPAPVVAIETPVKTSPDLTNLPHFDARNLDFIRLRTAMGLVLRQTGQSTEALEGIVARLGQAEARLSAPGGLDQGSSPLIDRMDRLEARLLAAAPPPVQPVAINGQAGAEGFLVGMAGLMKHLGTEIDRLQAASAPLPKTGDNPDGGQAASRSAEDELKEAIRRLNVLGSRMARALEIASPSAPQVDQAGRERLAHELRGQTAEFLAIGSALMTEMQKRA